MKTYFSERNIVSFLVAVFSLFLLSVTSFAIDTSSNCCKSGGCTASYDSTLDVVSITLGVTSGHKADTPIKLSHGTDADYFSNSGKSFTVTTYNELGSGQGYMTGSWTSNVYYKDGLTAIQSISKGTSGDLPSDWKAK